MTLNQLGSRPPFGSQFRLPEPTHLDLGQASSGVRAPQRKISQLAELFGAIGGEDGHEHIEVPENR